jgi:hypothetical protein
MVVALRACRPSPPPPYSGADEEECKKFFIEEICMHDNVLLHWLISITNSVRPAIHHYHYHYWTRPLLEERVTHTYYMSWNGRFFPCPPCDSPSRAA